MQNDQLSSRICIILSDVPVLLLLHGVVLAIINGRGLASVLLLLHMARRAIRGPETTCCIGWTDKYSTMASIELPTLRDFAKSSKGAKDLHEALRNNFGIEIPTLCWEGRLWTRLSSQIFNVKEDYTALREAIGTMQQYAH